QEERRIDDPFALECNERAPRYVFAPNDDACFGANLLPSAGVAVRGADADGKGHRERHQRRDQQREHGAITSCDVPHDALLLLSLLIAEWPGGSPRRTARGHACRPSK